MRHLFAILSLVMAGGCRAPEPSRQSEHTPAYRQKQIFLVIDDAGLALEETQQYIDIPVPMTIAVLPHLKQTREVCRAIKRSKDKEMILHQPMEAYDANADAGPGAIRTTTPPEVVPKILARNLDSVRGAIGMNNHMGSRITENSVLMREVLRYCKANNMFFLDSKTAYNSVVDRVANREHVHYEGRDVFLDIRHDRESIRRAWEDAVTKARNQGYAIVIGHVWSAETAAAIRDSYQTLLNQGYTFHLVSELYE